MCEIYVVHTNNVWCRVGSWCWSWPRVADSCYPGRSNVGCSVLQNEGNEEDSNVSSVIDRVSFRVFRGGKRTL